MRTSTSSKPFSFFRWVTQRPTLGNPLDTRKAALLDLFFLIFVTVKVIQALIIVGLTFFVDISGTDEYTIVQRVIVSIFLVVLAIFQRLLLKNGYLKTSVRLLAVAIISLATLLQYLNGHTFSNGIGIFPYVISLVLTASILSWRETLLFGFLSTACLLGLFTLGQMDLLPQYQPVPEMAQPITIVASIIVLLSFLRLEVISRHNLKDTLEELELQLVARNNLNLQLDHSTLHDPLTNLPNRRLIEEKIDLALEHSTENPENTFAVLFFDINRFKDINDTLGHITGDKVLIQFAEKLSSVIRTTDFAGRLGGDEFVILLNALKDPQEAMEIAKRVTEDLEEPFLIDNKIITISTSIGIAYANNKHTTSSEILHDADSAMYISKEQGTGSFAIFDAIIDERVRTTLALENDLPQAIINGEFLVYLHPIFKLDNLSLSGFEILTRWQHPTRGLINPDDYIPIAENSGTIMALDLHILERACKQILLWKESGLVAQNIYLSANLSPKGFEGVDSTPQIRALLTRLNFDPNLLTLEITEGALMTNINRAIISLKALKAVGIKISIDDFGTGYSSLSYLHLLPIDTMKIDRFFVMAMYESVENKKIVETIITLAKSLQMDIIAEGIEELDQLDHLKSLACDYGQGYYFTKPLNIEDTEVFLKTAQAKMLSTTHGHFGNGLSN